MRKRSESGIGHLLVFLLLLVVVASVAFVGMRVMQKQNDQKNDNTNAVQPLAKAQAPSTISNAQDLNTAKASLNQDNIDGDVNPNSLNSDVNSLL